MTTIKTILTLITLPLLILYSILNLTYLLMKRYVTWLTEEWDR